MKIAHVLLWLALLAAAGAGVFWWTQMRQGSGEESGAEKAEPSEVQVARIKRKSLAEQETSYGSVIAQPARLQVAAAAFETRVRHVLVAPGQAVKKGDALVEIEPSASALLQLRQAANAAEAAQRDLAETRSRFNLKLATNQDLGAAQKTANDTQLQLASLQQAGLGTDNRMKAQLDGIVAKVDVQPGQIVPSGGAQIETVAADDIEARLGVEPEDLAILKEGTPVKISPVQGGNSVEGQVRLITRGTNTETRLVDVYVSLPPQSGLLLDSYVTGVFERVATGTLVVPANAIQSDQEGYCVFTVEGDKAVRHGVTLGLAAGAEVEVTGTGLREGQTVVTLGSHELQDGGEVKLHGTAPEQ